MLQAFKNNSLLIVAESIGIAFFGALFIYAGLGHLRNPYAFLHSIDGYNAVPREVAVVAAIILPRFELLLGVFLLSRTWLKEVLACSAALFLLYFALQCVTIARGLDISCGCFGSSSRPVNYGSALLTTGFAISAMLLLATRSGRLIAVTNTRGCD